MIGTVCEGEQLFAVDFQAAAGSRPQVVGLDANDLLVVASLGNSAQVFGGNLLKNVQVGDQNVAVLPSGTDVTLTDQSREISFGEGKEKGSLAIDISNAPALVVHSLTTEAQLRITTNVQGATLTVDGSPAQRQKRGWLITGLVGTHNFTISAEGYQPQAWTMTLQRGQSLRKDVSLVRNAQPPTLTSLRITGSTPGAEVIVDGSRVGQIDSNGKFEHPNSLTIGKHTIVIARQYYESLTIADQVVSGHSPELLVPNAVLTPWPKITFQTNARNVSVNFRRVGDERFRDANPSEPVRLLPGQYEVVAEAPGYKKYITNINLGREDLSVPLPLEAIADYEFQDPNQIIHDGQLIKAKSPAKFVNLKPGLLHVNLVFVRPGKNLFWNKKVEWLIEAPGGKARVQYGLEGQKLTRKVVVGEEISDEKETKAGAQSASQDGKISLHVRVEGNRVRITNDKGVVLDDFTATGQDFANDKIAVKTDSHFMVRSDNQ